MHQETWVVKFEVYGVIERGRKSRSHGRASVSPDLVATSGERASGVILGNCSSTKELLK
jgi:hypothetical protein